MEVAADHLLRRVAEQVVHRGARVHDTSVAVELAQHVQGGVGQRAIALLARLQVLVGLHERRVLGVQLELLGLEEVQRGARGQHRAEEASSLRPDRQGRRQRESVAGRASADLALDERVGQPENAGQRARAAGGDVEDLRTRAQALREPRLDLESIVVDGNDARLDAGHGAAERPADGGPVEHVGRGGDAGHGAQRARGLELSDAGSAVLESLRPADLELEALHELREVRPLDRGQGVARLAERNRQVADQLGGRDPLPLEHAK